MNAEEELRRERRRIKRNLANNRSTKKNYTLIQFRLHNRKDAALIEKIQSLESKPEYFRKLILEDLEKNKEG